MAKRPVVSKLPKHGGKEPAFHAALGSIVTAEEYRSAVIVLVKGVEGVLENRDGKMEDFRSALRRLLLSRYDPPLPLYWTFFAVEKSLWLDSKSNDSLEVGTSTLEFASKLTNSLNALCAGNASGRTALSARAPIVGLLYDVASVLSTTVGSLDEIKRGTGTVDGTGKKVRKLARKLAESLKEVLGYTVLCSCKDSKTFQRSFLGPAAPNVPLEGLPDFLYPALPLASKKMVKSLRRDPWSLKVLAEIVFVEVVLLQLVVETIRRRILLKKQNATSTVGHDEFVQNLKSLAIHSVRAMSPSAPSEMVMDLLHMKRLPVRDLLDAKEEILVRGVLFEAVLVDDIQLFSLFGKADGEPKSSKSGPDHNSVVFMKKLSVARQAVAFLRSEEERFRLTTLLRDMETWHFPPQLLNWLSQKKQGLPDVALQSQQALTNWLVKVAEESVFAAILNKCVATCPSGLTSVGAAERVEVLEVESGDAHSEGAGEDLFFVDTAGETQAAIDSETAADLNFTAAAKNMQGDSDKIKKKEKKKKKQSTVLFHRHEQSSTGTKRSRIEIDDAHLTSSSGSDSEDSEENEIKSAKKKLKKSKRKVVDVVAASEENEDDGNDGALVSTHLASREERSPPGDVSNHRQEELLLQRIESPEDQTVEEDQVFRNGMKGGDAEEDAEELILVVDMQNASTVSQADPVLLSVGKSAKKKKKKSKDREGPDILEPADSVGRRRNGPQSVGRATKKLVSRSPEPSIAGEDDGYTEEYTIVAKAIQASEARADVPGEAAMDLVETVSIENKAILALEARAEVPVEAAKDLGETVTTESCEERPSSPPVSPEELVPLSVGKSAKKRKRKNKKLVSRSPEPSIVSKDDGHTEEDIVVTKVIQASEARADVPGEAAMDLVETVGTENKAMLALEARAEVPVEAAKDLGETVTTEHCEEPPSSPPVLGELVPLGEYFSVGKSAKKTQRKNKKLVGRSPELSIGSKDDGHTEEDIVVTKVIQASEARADVPGEAAMDLVETVGTENKAMLALEARAEVPVEVATDLGETVTTEHCEEPPSSPPVSLVELVPLSVGKAAKKKKKKSKDSEDPNVRQLTETVGRSKDTSVFNKTSNTEGEGDAFPEENLAVNTAIQDVDTRIDVQREAAKDLAQKVISTNSEWFPSSLLTPRNEGNDLGESGRSTAVLPSASPKNAQEDVHIVASSKKKRKGRNPRYGAEVDDLQIFDTIKEELVIGSANVSSADLIQALQVGKSLPADPQASSRKGRTPSKRARLGDEGNNIGDTPGIMTGGSAVSVSGVRSEKMNCANVATQDTKVCQGDLTLVEEEASLSATLMEEIFGSRQPEDASRRMQAESEHTKSTLPVHGVVLGLPSPVRTEPYLPVDAVVLGEDNGAQDTAQPAVEATELPMKNVVEETRLQMQGTPTSDMAGTSARPEPKKNRDLTSSPTSRKKRSKGQTDPRLPSVAEEMIQPKEEVCEEADLAMPAKVLDFGKGQDDRQVTTDGAVRTGEVSDSELLSSVQPPSRRRKAKPDTPGSTPKSVGSDTTADIFYQRRTRSGRALGTPTRTPTRRGNARTELVLESSQE